MNKNTFKNFSLTVIVLLLGVIFIINFGGPAILKSYIKAGIGDCQAIPILCMAPDEKIIKPAVKETCSVELFPRNDLPKISVCVPKGFTVVEERITKVYYKKAKRKNYDAVVYLLYEKPHFFIGLFPQLKKQGVYNDYEFIKRIMFAKFYDINTLTDAFFVIMKGIFIPNLGNQNNAKMIQFRIDDKHGFLNYNLAKSENYFDCDIFNKDGDFFKVYIKDKNAALDLDTVFSVIASIKKAQN